MKKIQDAQPDLIIVAGWSGLLSNQIISIPDRGTIGFHPFKLPNDPVRSVLAWQLEEGYTETALSMFYCMVLSVLSLLKSGPAFKIWCLSLVKVTQLNE